jgi:hypothetical protein
MSKVVPLGATWDATAALNAALEETLPDEQVMVVVRKANGDRCKYMANITNMEVHWEAAQLQDDIMKGRYTG